MYAELYLVDLLRNDPGVQAILGGGGAPNAGLRNVGTRITAYKGKEEMMPAITYESFGGDPDCDLPVERVMIKIRCWDNKASVARQLSYAVKQALHKEGGAAKFGTGGVCNYIYKTYADTSDTHEFMDASNKHTVWRIFEFFVQQ